MARNLPFAVAAWRLRTYAPLMFESPARAATPHPGMSFRAFVALIAATMAISALSIDIMLPALPQIGASIGIADPNDRQWIISAYFVGFGVGQLIYGPLSDRYGRKTVLLPCLGLFVVTCLIAAFADTFATMLTARALQGITAAATRIIAVSIVRDCYSGRTMARVMSLAFMVFLAVPILAPSLGQVVILAGPWQWIFGVLALFAGGVLLWIWRRLPETLDPANRRAISPGEIMAAAMIVLRDRCSIGYTIAQTLMFAGMIGYLNSSQQVFADAFGVPELFAAIFALCAVAMAIAAFVNSRVVERLGTRVVSHSALLAYIVIAAIHLTLAATGHETLASFTICQASLMGMQALAGSNFSAMAMEQMGRIAGTASSVQGFISSIGSTIVGSLIGQAFDGTTVPLTTSYAVLGIAVLGVVLWTEQGRLFRAHHAAVAPAE